MPFSSLLLKRALLILSIASTAFRITEPLAYPSQQPCLSALRSLWLLWFLLFSPDYRSLRALDDHSCRSDSARLQRLSGFSLPSTPVPEIAGLMLLALFSIDPWDLSLTLHFSQSLVWPDHLDFEFFPCLFQPNLKYRSCLLPNYWTGTTQSWPFWAVDLRWFECHWMIDWVSLSTWNFQPRCSSDF